MLAQGLHCGEQCLLSGLALLGRGPKAQDGGWMGSGRNSAPHPGQSSAAEALAGLPRKDFMATWPTSLPTSHFHIDPGHQMAGLLRTYGAEPLQD